MVQMDKTADGAAKRMMDTLCPSPKNPRKITDKKARQLQEALAAYGDMSGVVYNRRSKQLVGGHQRTAAFKQDASAVIHIERHYDTPTRTGTVAEGHILTQGERFFYREVDWDSGKEMAANLAANKMAGSFDMPEVADILRELGDLNVNLETTMFDIDERAAMVQISDFLPDNTEQPPRLDQKNMTLCPSCGHEF